MKNALVRLVVIFLLVTLAASAQSGEAASGDLDSAKSLYRNHKWTEAVAAYKAIVREAKSPESLVGLSRSFLKDDQVADSLDAAKKAVEIGSKYADAHVALGEVYFRKGLIAEAEREFVEGLKIDVTNARAFMGRARVFRAESLYRRAHDFTIKAHELDPRDPEIRRLWSSTLPPSQELAELDEYLAQEKTDDSDERINAQAYRSILKDELDHPDKRCKLVTKLDQVSVPLERFQDGPNRYVAVGLKAAINDHSALMVLDTGASGFILSPRAAEKAGVRAIARGTMMGAGDQGPVGRYVGRAESIKIRNLEFQNCLVQVAEKKTTLDVDGLIGSDVFDRYLISIDIPEQKLLLSQLPKPPDAPQRAQEGVPEPDPRESDSIASDLLPRDRYVASSMSGFSAFYRFGNLMLLPTSVNESAAKLFLLDTGAYVTLITPEAAREVTKVSNESSVQIKGVSGKVNNVYRADRVRIRFSRFRQESQGMLSFDMSRLSKEVGTELSGAIGFTLLNAMKITIDYRDGLIDFQYVARPRDPLF